MKLDDTNLLILQLLANQEIVPADGKRKPLLSIKELLEAIPGVRSIATIHGRLLKLEEAGYVNQPGRKMPRSRRITQEGQEALQRGLYGEPTPVHFTSLSR